VHIGCHALTRKPIQSAGGDHDIQYEPIVSSHRPKTPVKRYVYLRSIVPSHVTRAAVGTLPIAVRHLQPHLGRSETLRVGSV
jgi:hypothetical protein